MTFAPGAIAELIDAYSSGDVDDERMTRWLRYVFERGLSIDQTTELTLAMARSGDVIDWSDVDGPVVDKHSTGGVGDAVSLIAVPIAAACGAKVAKLSGRALGHTGGTIDKLECVPGLRSDLSIAEFKAQVAGVGCAIAAATDGLAPADKKLYALRDRTGTISSIPLIAASVMSKKIAAGAPSIVLDVMYGRGAFMQSIGDARTLADTMRTVGESAGKRVATILTSMEEPLARSAGDALELDEGMAVLEGSEASPALSAVAASVAVAMLEAAGLEASDAPHAARDGRALSKFAEMIAAQGGRLADFDRAWPGGGTIRASRSGVIDRIDARTIGEIVAHEKRRVILRRAGRVGVRLFVRTGDRVQRGDPLSSYWPAGGFDGLSAAFVVGDGPANGRP